MKHSLVSRGQSCPASTGSRYFDGLKGSRSLNWNYSIATAQVPDTAGCSIGHIKPSTCTVQRTQPHGQASSTFMTPDREVPVPEDEQKSDIQGNTSSCGERAMRQLLSPPRSSPLVDSPLTNLQFPSTLKEVIVIDDGSDEVRSVFEYIAVKNVEAGTQQLRIERSRQASKISRDKSTERAKNSPSNSVANALLSLAHSTPRLHSRDTEESLPPVFRPVTKSLRDASGDIELSARPLDSTTNDGYGNAVELEQLSKPLSQRDSQIQYRNPRLSREVSIPINIPPCDVVLESIETDENLPIPRVPAGTIVPDEEYEVERILGGGVRTDTGQAVYMVKWVGCEKPTIEPAEYCLRCPEKIAEWKAIPRADDIIKRFVEEDVRERQQLADLERQKRKEQKVSDLKDSMFPRGKQDAAGSEKRKSREGSDAEDSDIEEIATPMKPQGARDLKEGPTSAEAIPTKPQPRVEPAAASTSLSSATSRDVQAPPSSSNKRDLATLLRQERRALQPVGSKMNRLRQEFQGSEDVHPKRVRVVRGDGMRVDWVERR
ncbi:hypothetical protein PVAG01_08817 [Phlyctema vagabunda]|uniref:Chromo domain-containing protein n=1 Tax=Phlyctema vagabunda TaxID=108571 RepID=A0ABR4PAG8_9HELO